MSGEAEPPGSSSWFSARLRFVVLVDTGKPRRRNSYDTALYVLRAADEAEARVRALAIGRKNEVVYKNYLDQDVRWAFVEILEIRTLCIDGGRDLDGEEVDSEMCGRVDPGPIPFAARFRPELTEPPTP